MILRGCASVYHRLEADLQRELAEFDAMLQMVLHANQPNVTEEGDYSALAAIRQREFVDPDGQRHSLLTDREVQILSLRRGNLTPARAAGNRKARDAQF